MLKLLLPLCVVFYFAIGWVCDAPYANPLYSITTPELTVNLLEHQGQTSSKLEKVNSTIKQVLAEGWQEKQYLGITVGVLLDDQFALSSFQGYRDKSKQLTVLPSTQFRVASLTKPMTAIAIMQLVEKESLSLDDHVSRFLPEFSQENYPQFTIQNLLQHTSGIPHYQSTLEALSFTEFSSQTAAAIEIAKRVSPTAQTPSFQYSSYGYTLLGAVIEKVTALSYEQYMRQHIWQVADMTDTSLDAMSISPSQHYISILGSFLNSPITDLSIISAAGGVVSTASDMLKFSQGIFDNRFIGENSLRKMLEVTQASQHSEDDPYGMGWVVYNRANQLPIIAHSGAQPGASAYLELRLEQRSAIVVLSNAYGTKGFNYGLTQQIALALKEPEVK